MTRRLGPRLGENLPGVAGMLPGSTIVRRDLRGSGVEPLPLDERDARIDPKR